MRPQVTAKRLQITPQHAEKPFHRLCLQAAVTKIHSSLFEKADGKLEGGSSFGWILTQGKGVVRALTSFRFVEYILQDLKSAS
jgi:hypothetical protein